MPQGKISGLKKGGERSKPKRAAHGDQQKLRKGNFVFNTKVGKKQADDRAQKELTKKITARIESTMAARARLPPLRNGSTCTCSAGTPTARARRSGSSSNRILPASDLSRGSTSTVHGMTR